MSVTIIADFGSNWENEQDILDAIAPVKEAGADIFKLQYFNHRDLFGLISSVPEKPKVDLEKIALHCQDVGIEFMCSVFNPMDVAFVDRYVMRHKLAAAEASHPILLGAVVATGKPLIISVGGVDEPTLADISDHVPRERTSFLYCCSEYPARNVDLRFMDDIGAITGCDIGYSDHTLDIYQTARIAVLRHGATIIEKHVYNRKINGPDMPHSISTTQLSELVGACRGMVKNQRLQNRWFVRRPVATQHIEAWQKLEYGKNWGFYRLKVDNNFPPVDNFDFMATYRANSMISHHEIKAGQPIFLHNVRLVPRD